MYLRYSWCVIGDSIHRVPLAGCLAWTITYPPCVFILSNVVAADGGTRVRRRAEFADDDKDEDEDEGKQEYAFEDTDDELEPEDMLNHAVDSDTTSKVPKGRADAKRSGEVMDTRDIDDSDTEVADVDDEHDSDDSNASESGEEEEDEDESDEEEEDDSSDASEGTAAAAKKQILKVAAGAGGFTLEDSDDEAGKDSNEESDDEGEEEDVSFKKKSSLKTRKRMARTKQAARQSGGVSKRATAAAAAATESDDGSSEEEDEDSNVSEGDDSEEESDDSEGNFDEDDGANLMDFAKGNVGAGAAGKSSIDEAGDSDDSDGSEEEDEDSVEGEDDEESEDDEEGEDESEDGDVEIGTLKWKSNLAEKASDAYFRRKEADLHSYIYGARATMEGEQDADSDANGGSASEQSDADDGGNLFSIKKGRNRAEVPDSSRDSMLKSDLHDWDNQEVLETIRNKFVTGEWDENEDAAKLLADHDDAVNQEAQEIYGDFEDMETGEVHSAPKPDGPSRKDQAWKAGGAAEDEDEEGLGDAKATEEELEAKRMAKKAAFDNQYDNKETEMKGDYFDEQKQEQAEQTQRNRSEFEDVADELRVQYEGYRPGMYVRIEIDHVPCELITNFDPTMPLVVGGLLPAEMTMGYIQLRFKKHRWHKRILKTRDPIILSLGWRRFQTVPL